MTVIDFLRQPQKLDLQIRNKLIERQQYQDIALGITSCTEGSRVSASGPKSKMADAVDRLVDTEAEVNALVDRLIDSKKEVIAAIERVDNPTWYQFYKKKWDADVLYRRIRELEVGIGKTPGIELVRCKDCKHWLAEEPERCKAMKSKPYGLCNRYPQRTDWQDTTYEDDFCSYGERK